MDDLMNHALLQPAHITKVLDEIIPDNSEYMLTQEIPMVTQETEVITIDVRDNIGGMTQAVAQGAESPLVEYRGQSQVSFSPAHFREKTVLGERDLKVIRKIGTASELERAEARIAEVVGGLRMRLETRIEWCKWQMVFGTLAIAQTDVQFSVDYKIPSTMTPTLTGTDKWDDLVNSDPLDDMMEWLYLYRHNGINPKEFVFNRAVEKLLMQNNKVRELRDSYMVGGVAGSSMMSSEILARIVSSYVGIPYRVYDKGYYFKMKLETAISSVTTAFIVSENPGVVTGDTVTVVHKNGSRYGTLNIVVTPTGLSFAHAAVGGSYAFPAGSAVIIKKQFIPDTKFLVMGALPPGTTGGQNFAEFVSTPSPYNGGLLNAQPGPFGKTVVDNDGDPPKAYVVAGVSGLPVLYHSSTNLIATVT